jgi:hypothetical protein
VENAQELIRTPKPPNLRADSDKLKSRIKVFFPERYIELFNSCQNDICSPRRRHKSSRGRSSPVTASCAGTSGGSSGSWGMRTLVFTSAITPSVDVVTTFSDNSYKSPLQCEVPCKRASAPEAKATERNTNGSGMSVDIHCCFCKACSV